MERKPLYYTFGNHMHWADMEWLWGYDVLPGSVRDMLALVRETGARANVNFDGVGYEKLAAEHPRALDELRQAVEQGLVEPVGCSYGQPYGLFHGGESNVRQLAFGIRAVLRLLGVRPKAFWEEEFYFFPQLPQLLASCGYTSASLFFQWTWHTPEVPREPHSLVLWEGLDGTRLPTLPRTALNVHQWPEDFDGLLESELVRGLARPAVVQWLELMPSKDWMCRGEVLLPRLKELMADERFEVRPRTMSRLVEELVEGGVDALPVRRYGMDDVWHGMSLGKNGDAKVRASRACEQQLLAAEAASALVGLFGRPYPSWDVYPAWELDEAWRELLAAQHHDNHECEGLCGFVGETSFSRSAQLSAQVVGRSLGHLLARARGAEGATLAFNPFGWPRDVVVTVGAERRVVRQVPPFGYAVVEPDTAGSPVPITVEEDDRHLVLSRGELRVVIDRRQGLVRQLCSAAFPDGALDPARPLGQLWMLRPDGPEEFDRAEVIVEQQGGAPAARVVRFSREGAWVLLSVRLHPTLDGLELAIVSSAIPRPMPRMLAGLQLPITPAFAIGMMLHDQPYGVNSVRADGSYRRKYPTGDWMTSPQEFEEVHRPFTALSFVDLLDGQRTGRGLLCAHDGSQQFFRDERGIRCLLSMEDPWDEGRFNPRLQARLLFVPHGELAHHERARLAAALASEWSVAGKPHGGGELPMVFGPLSVEGAPGVLVTAFYRDSPYAGRDLPDWAGHRLARDSAGACTHPYVVRLVEYDGRPAEVTLKLAGPVALAAKTNLLGEVGAHVGGGTDTCWLEPIHQVEPPAWAVGATFRGEPVRWSALRFRMRAREVATIMADLEMGRKEVRDLDAARHVWARVHRTED